MKIAMSVGHGLHVRGASGLIDEVDEAQKVVMNTKSFIMASNRLNDCVTFFDETSTTQQQNLNTIVNWHNSQTRDFDVSVHFNAYIPTEGGRGTEVLFVSQQALAERVSTAIASASGLIDRGAHKRSDLYFLNGTTEPAILIEVCFVDAAADVAAYEKYLDAICEAIANALITKDEDVPATQTQTWIGKTSWFGGPEDMGVSPSEGLAFIYDYADAPYLFLAEQPPGTTGLARRLDPEVSYIALRWDYDQFPKEMLASGKYFARVRSPKTGQTMLAYPADWGPHVDTGRVADISPGLMAELGIATDDEVEVTFPVEA